jgi:outer membrane receptor for ferric coprogen and ferric-rhodotorulic acid
MAYPYNGILFDLEKEWSTYTYYSMDKLWKHSAE